MALVAVACGISAYLSTRDGPAKAGVAFLIWPVDFLVISSTAILLYCCSSWSLPPVTKSGIVYDKDGLTREDRILAIQRGDRIRPKAHEIVELISTISFLVHVYALCIRSWTNLQSL